MTQKPPTYTLDDGPDVDLDRDDVRDSQGRRITQEYVDDAVADVHRRSYARKPKPKPPEKVAASAKLPAKHSSNASRAEPRHESPSS